MMQREGNRVPTMTYDDLQEALRTLGLGDRAGLKEIKARHRELVKRYHPDAGNMADPERIRRINAAYRILADYVGAYRFKRSSTPSAPRRGSGCSLRTIPSGGRVDSLLLFEVSLFKPPVHRRYDQQRQQG